jgi:AcrR family transcriptional regulator
MNTGGDPQPRPRDEAKALFRKAILDSAEAVFAERGFHHARIQDVAERARIAVGTVYNHFEDKDEVLVALLVERTEELLEHLASAEGDPPTFEARLEARVARVLGHVKAHRAFFSIATEHGMFASTVPAGAPASAKRLRKLEKFRAAMGALVEEGVSSGDLEPHEGDLLVRFFGTTLRGFVLALLDATDFDVPAQARQMVDLFLHGAARRKTKRAR